MFANPVTPNQLSGATETTPLRSHHLQHAHQLILLLPLYQCHCRCRMSLPSLLLEELHGLLNPSSTAYVNKLTRKDMTEAVEQAWSCGTSRGWG